MQVALRVGDVLDECADVLICTANPTLAMSGGVNGALYLRGGESVQRELKDYLSESKRTYVDAGTVLRTGPGPLAVKHILHAVGVNMFYESSVELVRDLLRSALERASILGAQTVATPALATGYGPLTIRQFAEALAGALSFKVPGIEKLVVVLREPHALAEVRATLERAGIASQDP